MHETFVYSTSSQLLQVTFWNAYRDFFTNESTVSQLLSASEVIKNVTVAFPGASAKVWDDAEGKRRFVIAGMGFRREGGTCLHLPHLDQSGLMAEDDDRFYCSWRQCPGPKFASPAKLFSHVESEHLSPTAPDQCQWASCSKPFSVSHVLTHIPSTEYTAVPEHITIHPSLPDRYGYSAKLSDFPPAPLPRSMKLAYTGHITPSDERLRTPVGPSFLAALVLRNLSRALRAEIALAAPEERSEKKKHLLEERFGLPIPDSVLKEEEEEARDAEKEIEETMSSTEQNRAVGGFQSVEGRLLDIMEANLAGLGEFLTGAVGW